MLFVFIQITNNITQTPTTPQPVAPNPFIAYIPLFSLVFVILSFIFDRIIANRSKRKQILRDWYGKSLLDPCVAGLSKFTEDIKILTNKHVVVFDEKSDKLSIHEFLRYKANINSQFESIKLTFYNESILPIYYNYKHIGDAANDVLLSIQDSYVILFGSKKVVATDYYEFLNNLYSQKGRLLAILKQPLTNNYSWYNRFMSWLSSKSPWHKKKP